MRWIGWLLVLWAALAVGLYLSAAGTALGAVALVAFLRAGRAFAARGGQASSD